MLTINNTLDGYLKDVEILGNTIQNEEDLADIRSVGDKVEGQELYEIPVLSVGKNINTSKSELGGLNGNNGTINNNLIDRFMRSADFIKVTPNSDIITNMNGYPAIFEYDENFDFIKYTSGVKIRTSENTRYLKFHWERTDITIPIQFEYGTVATPYEPYQEDKLTILSPVQLEKVGDVADRIVCKDGVWGVEKNVETVVLDGENLRVSSLLGDTTGEYIRYHIPTVPVKTINVATINVLSNKLQATSQVIIDTLQQESISSHSGGGVQLKLNKAKGTTVTEINNYLKFNNIIVKYNGSPQFIPLPHSQQIKLRTFANKTNISFLTEIEGTIKAQVPKSLGATVNTHTEQINNLNKELDRVKKLEESTVSTVTTESDFTTVEATSNGYFEDVKLEGKTLVNLIKDGNIQKNLGKGNTTLAKYSYNRILDVDKIYTFICKVSNVEESRDDRPAISFNSGMNGSGVRLNNGMNIFTFKNNVNLTSDKQLWIFYLDSSSVTSTNPQIDYIYILEGDHTQNPPTYFEGLKSVGQSATTSEDGVDEISVESVKGDGNLVEYIELNGVNSGDGKDYTGNKYVRTNYITVEPNQTYYIKLPTNVLYSTCAVYSYNSNKSYLGHKSGLTSEFTTVANTKFIRIDMKKADDTGNTQEDVNNCDFVVSKCRVTEYVPRLSDKKRLLYYNNETQTWEKPILREWDSIEKHSNGKYYYHQRSAEVVLNGSEDWGEFPKPFENTIAFQLHMPLVKHTTDVGIVADKIQGVSYLKVNIEDVEGISLWDNQSFIRFRISKSKLSTQDVQGFKQCLQANNVTAVYQLAQEKVYECTNIDLITYANETNYIVESGVLSPKTTLKVHNNISNVVSLLQKKVSLLESNVTSYMITQNRLMLASRYNADTVSFKVDVATLRNSFEYDNDLYELILNNILVGKDNYNREYIENLIIFYWMDFIISDEMYSTLFEIIEEQHNPKIEEETPLI